MVSNESWVLDKKVEGKYPSVTWILVKDSSDVKQTEKVNNPDKKALRGVQVRNKGFSHAVSKEMHSNDDSVHEVPSVGLGEFEF